MSTTIYNTQTKQCSKCNEIKSYDDFGKDRRSKDGYNFNCKQCRNKYYKDNKEVIIQKVKQYYHDNKDRISTYRKQYGIDNKKMLSSYKQKHKKSPTLYKTYGHQLTIEEEPRLSEDGTSLDVRCKYCGKYFKPTNREVVMRITSIDGNRVGESSLYCSTNCKTSCGTYGQKKYPKGFKVDTSREVQPQLRKLVLERDNYTCQTCGNDNVQLHCHHYEGIEINPVESADIDNCITLCKKCHNDVHKHCDMRRGKC